MIDKFIHKLFATPVFQFKVKDHEKLNIELSKYIYDLYKNDKEGTQRSNVGGWHSKNFKLEKGSIPHNFVNTIHEHVKEVIIDGFGWKFNPEKVGVTEIWGIINKKNSGISGGLFFTMAEIGGILGPFSIGFIYDYTNDFNYALIFYSIVFFVILIPLFLLKNNNYNH